MNSFIKDFSFSLIQLVGSEYKRLSRHMKNIKNNTLGNEICVILAQFGVPIKQSLT